MPHEADRGHPAPYNHHPDPMMQRDHAATGSGNHPGYRTPLVHRPFSYAEGGSVSPSTHGQSPHWRPYPERRSEPEAAHPALRPPVRSASLSSAPQYGPPGVLRRSPSPGHWNVSKAPMEPAREGFPRGPSPSHSHGGGAASEENGRSRPALPQRSWSTVTLPPLRDLDIRDSDVQDARPYPPEYHRSMSYGSYTARSSTMESMNSGGGHPNNNGDQQQQQQQKHLHPQESSNITPIVSFRYVKSPSSLHPRASSPTRANGAGSSSSAEWSPACPSSAGRYAEHERGYPPPVHHHPHGTPSPRAEHAVNGASHKHQPPHHTEIGQYAIEEESVSMAVDERR
ncbi:hypothetical protein DFQ27_001388 [Actinomortierella ambigua]|uniref:Uncharacterized protein n=1 Tax=Actinomortierella ambigua TaxID=1343610 RepID=A0A9P6QAM1_9FUNG|nr:hypothetical protein DFQ26_008540 [Actinomortierella ambigua]KAG0264154.1 hypothetical protein DFQ27_001388 [Actinomortierella ambigua]